MTRKLGLVLLVLGCLMLGLDASAGWVPLRAGAPASAGLTGESVSTGSVATTSAGVETQAAGTCSAADSFAHDNNGVIGCPKLTDVAPQGAMIRPQPDLASGAQTAADGNLFGGMDELKIAIDGADPSATCTGTNTVTVTVTDSNGSATATILTRGTEWTATSSVSATCTSLASAVDALAGVSASCTSPNVLIRPDDNTGQVQLAESTAACTTVSTGTQGVVNVITLGASTRYGILCLGPKSDTGSPCVYGTASGAIVFNTRGASAVNITANIITATSNVVGSGTITSSRTTDLGWSVVAGANTACNTTCTSAAVFGVNTDIAFAAGDFVGPADATADVCVCAGGS